MKQSIRFSALLVPIALGALMLSNAHGAKAALLLSQDFDDTTQP